MDQEAVRQAQRPTQYVRQACPSRTRYDFSLGPGRNPYHLWIQLRLSKGAEPSHESLLLCLGETE